MTIRVKSLVWEQITYLWPDIKAKTPFGDYVVAQLHDEDFLRLMLDDVPLSKHWTHSDAKAAAQANFERRILSVIEVADARAMKEDEG